MGDAAQGEPRQHEVFSKPFKVQPAFESWKTPNNYRGYPGGKDLPDQIKVWRIQNTGKDYGSVASASYGFEDSPDAEILTAGYNVGKESGAVGVGRHGNFLQWGFSAPPSKMTESGKCFFLNCICYIHKFDGKLPLVRVQTSDRLRAVHLAMVSNRITDPKFRTNTFAPELLEKSKGDADALAKYLQENLELIYRDGKFRVDAELPAMGLQSNRKVGTLQRLIELLDDSRHASGARKALKRYTRESFETPQEWRMWFEKSRDRIYFTDVGGYKFLVVPQGYPTGPQPPRQP
jgi:hypothetical protein